MLLIITTVPARAVLSGPADQARDVRPGTWTPPEPPEPPEGSSGPPPVDGLAGIVVVQVEGEVDLYSGPALRDVLEALLPAPQRVRGRRPDAPGSTASHAPPEPVRAVVVDLSAVTFIDSYALGVLVQGHRLARPGGRAYAVVATHPSIRSLFAVTGLARVMPLQPDVLSAVAALQPAA